MAKSTNEPTYKKNLGGTLDLKGNLNATRIRQYYKKHWLIIALTWILTVASSSLTSFFIHGWVAFIIGIILSAIFFFSSIWWPITKVIEKDIYHNL